MKMQPLSCPCAQIPMQLTVSMTCDSPRMQTPWGLQLWGQFPLLLSSPGLNIPGLWFVQLAGLLWSGGPLTDGCSFTCRYRLRHRLHIPQAVSSCQSHTVALLHLCLSSFTHGLKWVQVESRWCWMKVAKNVKPVVSFHLMGVDVWTCLMWIHVETWKIVIKTDDEYIFHTLLHHQALMSRR